MQLSSSVALTSLVLLVNVSSAVTSSLSGPSLLQSWSGMLASSSGHDTPVTRVVNLLKEMGKTVQAEMNEDEGLYRKLKCWCTDNSWAKSNSIEKSKAALTVLERPQAAPESTVEGGAVFK